MASDWIFNFWKKHQPLKTEEGSKHENVLIKNIVRFLTIVPRLPDLETEYQILISELEDCPDHKTFEKILIRLEAYVVQSESLYKQQQDSIVKRTQIQIQKICYNLEQRLGLDSARTSFALWLQHPDQIHDLEKNIEKLSFLIEELSKSKKQEAQKWDIFTQAIPPGEKAILALGMLDQKDDLLATYGEKGLRDIMLDVAHSLQTQIKRYDFFAQIEQQYYVMIFGNCELKHAQEILERLKKNLHKHSFQYNNIPLNLSFSFGLMCLREKIPPLIQVQHAEKALKDAQKEGVERLIFVEHD